jgi:hypothetical protein
MSVDGLHLSPYHENTFAEVRIGVAHLSGYPMTVVEYEGYRIEVSSVGKGWRASIFAPGTTRALADSPVNLEKSPTEEIVAEAKRIIDARLGRQSL